jgi:Tfp pilus assembly protein PilF
MTVPIGEKYYFKKWSLFFAFAVLLPSAATAQDASYARLLEQARFWTESGRADLAEDSLRRVLASDESNSEALYQMALLELNRSNSTAADKWAEKLRLTAPKSKQWEELSKRLRRKSLDDSVLAKARTMAARGESEKSAAIYRELFAGEAPPDDLALEYYQTLAGSNDGWQEARQGLAQLAKLHPQNYNVALAHAEMLTYRSETRSEGADRLALLWDEKQDERVRKAWRQSLLWLPATPRYAESIKSYIKKFPDDQEVLAHLNSSKKDTGQAQAQAYDALKKGNLREAKAAFNTALQAHPNDAEAVAGMGLIQLRNGQFTAADSTLTKAMSMAPKSAGKWRDARDSARFYASLEGVRQKFKAGQFDAAYSAVLPLTNSPGVRGQDARLLQAEILMGKGRAGEAEAVYRRFLIEVPNSVAARSGLVRSLIVRKEYNEAEIEFAKLPEADRKRLGYLQAERVNQLRERGASLIAKGQASAGEIVLREAMVVAPDDPWLRLELARLYDDRKQPARARAMLAPLVNQGSNDGLTVAAMLAEKQQRWLDVEQLIERIPSKQRGESQQALLLRANRGHRIQSLKAILERGDPVNVEMALDDVYRNPPATPSELGQVAGMLLAEGERSLALALVRRDLDGGFKASPQDYLDHLAVLMKSDNEREAQRLLGFLEREAGGDENAHQVLAQASRDILLAQVSKLQADKKFAEAYDLLVTGLEDNPDDSAMLLVLAGLYRQGNYFDHATQVYQYVYEQGVDTQNAALIGLTETALAADDPDTAESFLQQAAPLESPDWLILAARTAEAQGDKRQALAFVEQARMAAAGELRDSNDSGEYLFAENPFRNRLSGLQKQDGDTRWRRLLKSSEADSFADTGAWLPGRTAVAGRWRPERADRKFVDRRFDSEQTASSDDILGSPYDDKMPLQWSTRYWQDEGREHLAAATATSKRNESHTAATNSQRREIAGIDTYRSKLKKDLSPRVRGDIAMRFRQGEEGLSQLAEVSGELAFSGVPVGNGRLEAVVTPVFLNAGTLDEDSAGRFYRSAVYSSISSGLAEKLNRVGPIIDQVDISAQELALANAALEAAQGTGSAQEVAALEARVQTAQRNFGLAVNRNPLYEVGIDLDRLSVDQRQFVDDYLLQQFGDNNFSLAADDVASYQVRSKAASDLISKLITRIGAYNRTIPLSNNEEAGLGVELNYQRDTFVADIGSTPLGFEITNLVGGISWTPKISSNTELRLQAQRRAVVDSLLSYAGVKDPLTGDRWGAVTRSGANIGLAFDNEDLGFYGDFGFYYYDGENVKGNQMVQANFGAYLRPIHRDQTILQTGVNVGYSSFDDNLSKFTYGHGGYFSPQSYVSLAFPINYSEKYKKLSWNAGASLGFQSYSVASAAYFPTLAYEQRWLDILAESGGITESRYKSESESGFGMNLGAGMRYELSPALSIGSRISYDTFGDYSETSAVINFLYNTDP